MTVFKKHLLVIVWYIVLAMAMTWPVAANIRTDVAGIGGDPWQTMWRFDNKLESISTAIDEGDLWDFAVNEWGGGGPARLVNLSVWPWMWLWMMFGRPAAYNIIWLLTFIISGYGTYLLTARLIADNHERQHDDGESSNIGGLNRAALLAGMIYMFLPYHAAHALGHFGAMQVQWMPLIVLTMWSVLKRPGIWKMVLLGMLVTVQAWSEHHYALWLLIFAVLFVIGYRSEVRKFWRQIKGRWGVLVLAVMLAVTVILPYWPTIRLAGGSSVLQLGDNQVTRFSTDLLAVVVPPEWHPVWGNMFDYWIGQHFTGNVSEATGYLGLTLVLLLIFFHQRIPDRELKFWLVVISVFGLISLGPKLHLVGWVSPLPLPYALVQDWPVFSAVRTVGRALVMVGLAWAVLLGWVFETQFRQRWTWWAMGGVVLIEFLFMPVAMQSARLPEAYDWLRDQPGATVIELPAATNYTIASRGLLGEDLHGKKVIGNNALERAEGSAANDEVRSLPALRQVLFLRTTHLLEDRDEFFDQNFIETWSETTEWLDARTVVIHTDSLSKVQNEAVRHFFQERLGLMPETVGDAEVYVLAGDNLGDGVFMSRNAGWQNVGFDEEKGSIFAEVSDKAELELYNIKDHKVEVLLSWAVPIESSGELQVEGAVLVSDNVEQDGGRRAIVLSVASGKTQLRLRHEGDGKSIIQDPKLRVIDK